MKNLNSQIVIYKDKNGHVKIDVRFDGDTVWLTQNSLAELFQTTKQNIGQHIKNIVEEGELLENSTVKKFFTVQKEGNREVKRKIDYYNLDMIISVGYRIKSSIATSFRKWATERLSEYIVKGFVIDSERLKNPDFPSRRRVPMTMKDWIEKLHGFLTINDRNILQDAGRISHELMKEIAEKKFDEYKRVEARQDVDFDEAAMKAIESVKGKRKINEKLV